MRLGDPEPFEQVAHRAGGLRPAVVAECWPGARASIVHRTGRLEIGEASVVIAVSSPHRAEAFEACRWAIDTLKTAVPIWKKEIWSDGEAWIEGVPAAPIRVPE